MTHQALRIAQFADSFPPVINGVSAFVAEHHAELLAQGHDAHVFTFGYQWHKRQDEPRNVHRTFGLPIGTSPFRANIGIDARSRAIAKMLDVFHIHEPFGIGWMCGRPLAQRWRKPFVLTIHTRHDIYLKNWRPRWVQPALQWQARRTIADLIRQSATTTAPSEDTAQWLRRLAPDSAQKIRVIRNGIRLDHFDQLDGRAMRAKFDIADDATVFAYVGRITPEKNLFALADAIQTAIKAGANLHWFVIGDGECLDELKARVEPIQTRAHFVGAVPREVVPRYLAVTDVLTMPSLSEVNPVSVIEALAAGKPFVGMQAAWWREFDGERAGVLANDEGEFAQAIITMCECKPKRDEMSLAAKRLSRRFDIRDVTAQWLNVYRDVIIEGRK
jgi:glycosyltransferase involved in cell wall biosynthesis